MAAKKEVKSKNQSGGITAFNVGSEPKFPSEKNKYSNNNNNFWKYMGYIGLIAGIIAAVYTVLSYYKI